MEAFAALLTAATDPSIRAVAALANFHLVWHRFYLKHDISFCDGFHVRQSWPGAKTEEQLC